MLAVSYTSGAVISKPVKKARKVNCVLTKNMKDNHEMWVEKIKEEEQQIALTEKLESLQQVRYRDQKKKITSVKCV